MKHNNPLPSILPNVHMGFVAAMILALTLMFSSFAFAQRDPFGELDTCRITTFQDEKKNQVMASVSIFNDEELSGMTLPFRYGNGQTPIRCDSIKFDKTRIEYFTMRIPRIDTAKQTILLGLLPDLFGRNPPLKKGDGEVVRIYFSLKRGVQFQDFFLDTTVIRPFNRLKFVGPNVKGIFPVFDNKKAMIKGGIPIKSKLEKKAIIEEEEEEKSSKKDSS